jgi:3-dehydroquinate synthase
MLAALDLSEKLAGLPPQEAARGRGLIHKFGLARRLPRLDPQAVLSALALDKKRQADRVVFVLLRRLGEPVIQENVPLGLIKEVLVGEVFGGGLISCCPETLEG